jgi:hypothetical protein
VKVVIRDLWNAVLYSPRLALVVMLEKSSSLVRLSFINSSNSSQTESPYVHPFEQSKDSE